MGRFPVRELLAKALSRSWCVSWISFRGSGYLFAPMVQHLPVSLSLRLGRRSYLKSSVISFQGKALVAMYVYTYRWPVIHRNVAATLTSMGAGEKSGSGRAAACP